MTAPERNKLTDELYAQLPIPYESRIARLDIRDQVFELNINFFHYVAKKKVFDTDVPYDDKVQSAMCAFCELWYKYKWVGDENHRGYRTDLAFSSFFKPRIGEVMDRQLNVLKYSTFRSMKLDAAKQAGVPVAQLRYDDLERVTLPANVLASLKVMFQINHNVELSEVETIIPDLSPLSSMEVYTSTRYNTLDGLLIREMALREAPLSDSDLMELSELYSIPYKELKKALPIAMDNLYRRLKMNQE